MVKRDRIRISAVLHRGTEKLIEHEDLSSPISFKGLREVDEGWGGSEAVPYFRPAGYMCAPYEPGARLSARRGTVAGFRGADPGQLIRVLYSESGRVLNHLLKIHDIRRWNSARMSAAALGFLRRAREADGVLRAGQRRAACTRPISGPAASIRIFPDRGAGRGYRQVGSSPFLKTLDDLDKLLTHNRILQAAQTSISVSSASEEAWAWGCSGGYMVTRFGVGCLDLTQVTAL